MLWLFVALMLGGAGYFFWAADKKSQKALPKSKGPRTVFNLQINDIVSHFGTDYLVEGKLIFEDDGSEWFVYRLVDDDDTIWLSVEDDDDIEVGLYRTVKELRFTERPPEHINYEGDRYELVEYGRAKVTRVGRTGTKSAGSVKYYEYEGPNDRQMSVEQWGEGEFEVSVGEPIRYQTLEILPGDDVEEMSNMI